MKKILVLLAMTVFLGAVWCFAGGKPSSHLSPPSCSYNSHTVEFDVDHPGDITFCVRSNGTLEICSLHVCKQVLNTEHSRKWHVEKNGTKYRFVDELCSFSANTHDTLPILIMPFHYNGCDLELDAAPSSDGGCPFLLIGKDDIRNDGNLEHECEEYDMNILNDSGKDDNAVQLRIIPDGSGGYDLALKYNPYTGDTKPPTCDPSSCKYNFCVKSGVTGSTNCPDGSCH